MVHFFLAFVLLIFVFLQSSVSSTPVVLAWLISSAIVYKTRSVYLLAILGGELLDVLSFRVAGLSSTFFLSILIVVFLYERKFEIQTPQFVFIATVVSTFFYAWFEGFHYVIPMALFNGVIACLFFYILSVLRNRFSPRKKKDD